MAEIVQDAKKHALTTGTVCSEDKQEGPELKKSRTVDPKAGPEPVKPMGNTVEDQDEAGRTDDATVKDEAAITDEAPTQVAEGDGGDDGVAGLEDEGGRICETDFTIGYWVVRRMNRRIQMKRWEAEDGPSPVKSKKLKVRHPHRGPPPEFMTQASVEDYFRIVRQREAEDPRRSGDSEDLYRELAHLQPLFPLSSSASNEGMVASWIRRNRLNHMIPEVVGAGDNITLSF
jgi:hypothetical protein